MNCQLRFMITYKMLRATVVHPKMLPATNVSFPLRPPLSQEKHFRTTEIMSKDMRVALHGVLCKAIGTLTTHRDWGSGSLGKLLC